MGSLIDFTINNKYSAHDTSRNVKPDKPKGYLVKTPVYKIPVEYFQDLATDTYGIVKGLSGKANDHELGKQNDVAMKIGSLGIMAYLMSFRPSKMTKLMEVIGFGSFFTSMALWPKIAISLPLKLRTGVDMQQKYVDSYGRKKNFFQDPQYLAWDLFTREQIDKMGEKMGVPYDVPNRDEVIKEKARKAAVQGNTLWMATAGFATPIMTGLICSGLEPVVENLRQKYALKHSQKIMDDRSLFKSNNSVRKSAQKDFETFLSKNMGSKIPDNSEIMTKLNWTSKISPNLERYLSKDLDKLLSHANNEISFNFADEIYNAFSKTLKSNGIEKSDIREIFETNKLVGLKPDTAVKQFTKSHPESYALDLETLTKELLDGLIDKKVPNKADKLKDAIKSETIERVVKEFDRKILDEKTADKLRNVFNELSNYFEKEGKLGVWENARCADSADAMTAHSWKSVSKEVFSALGFSTKEIEQMSKEGSKTAEIFGQKIKELVKNPNEYKDTVRRIAEKIADFDAVMGKEAREKYFRYVDDMCDLAKKGLSNQGFKNTADYIGGRDFISQDGVIKNLREALCGTSRNHKKIMFDNKVLGERASFYRILQLLDYNKRLYDGTLKGQYDVITEPIDNFFRPAYARIAQKGEKALMSRGMDAFETKFGNTRFGKNAYKTLMRMLYGAMPDEYVINMTQNIIKATDNSTKTADTFRKICSEKGVEAGYRYISKKGYDKVKLNMARTGMSQETVEALYEAGKKRGVNLIDNMKEYMQTFIDKVVNFGENRSFKLEEHNTDGAMKKLADKMSPSLRKALIGFEPEKFVRNTAQETFNGRKWMKTFGIAGAILFAGTVLSTMFFGHIPQREMYMRNGNK